MVFLTFTLFFYRVNWCTLDFSFRFLCFAFEQFPKRYVKLIALTFSTNVEKVSHVCVCVYAKMKITSQRKALLQCSSLMALLCVVFPLTQWIRENWWNTQNTHQLLSNNEKNTKRTHIVTQRHRDTLTHWKMRKKHYKLNVGLNVSSSSIASQGVIWIKE